MISFLNSFVVHAIRDILKRTYSNLRTVDVRLAGEWHPRKFERLFGGKKSLYFVGVAEKVRFIYFVEKSGGVVSS